MNYIIEMMNKSIIEITDEEFSKLQGKQGSLYFPSVGQVVNLQSVSRIVPKKTYLIDEMEQRRSTQKEGVLHDGRKVVKHFGVWYHADGDYDNRGNPLTQVYDRWYPEAARDCIPTVSEYHRFYAHLPKQERLKALLQHYDQLEAPRTGEVESLASIMEKQRVRPIELGDAPF